MAPIFFASLILSSFAATFNANDTTAFDVRIELLNQPTPEEISVKVSVKNNTGKTFDVPQDRRTDYYWGTFKSIGNYIIQIEQLQADSFHLFPPTADINSSYKEPVYIKFLPGQTIIDTIMVNGFSFTGDIKVRKGFPAGIYRLKISFNKDEWGTSIKNSSNWIEFKIE